ncbi:hypothetical protein [Tichowtungia aerotolerans]|uniref:Uncharacterized protein n=1 Tax=Tichowtungia aerotolerans TaxID=2697043 RepID=A0A6P1MB96_9BACT|nr:hypothetical protein [Tichowtungia aerotolerans]QHI69814.1 hypothetical protein GT409_10255 [Tichowtungia aerotolerans]
MMKKMICIFGMLVQFACAELGFAPISNDGAVLQCEMPVNVWGTAAPGATVTVTFAGQEKKAVASDGGKWQVVLNSMSASSTARTMTLSSSGHPSSQCSNLTVGEVWLASGQLNMAFGLGSDKQGTTWAAQTIPELHYVLASRKSGIPVNLICSEVREPESVRYAWHSWMERPVTAAQHGAAR